MSTRVKIVEARQHPENLEKKLEEFINEVGIDNIINKTSLTLDSSITTFRVLVIYKEK